LERYIDVKELPAISQEHLFFDVVIEKWITQTLQRN
jgi:hypothetical protein